jgi:hypothetical protein
MKHILTFFILFGLLNLSISQQNNDWKGVFLDPTGNHIQQGVEAYFKTSVCEGKEVVLLKFVNNNNYNVELSWFNAYFTSSKTWVKHNKPEQQVVFYLPANTVSEGNCQNNTQLVFALDEVDLTANTFLRLTTEYLRIKKMD